MDTREAVAALSRYVSVRRAMPMRGIGNSVHQIHAGTEHEAEITFDHLKAITALLKDAVKTLAPFSSLAINYSNAGPSDAVFAKGCVYVCDLRAARDFLAKLEAHNAK